MTCFLATAPNGPGKFSVELVLEPHHVLNRGGLASPVFFIRYRPLPDADLRAVILLFGPAREILSQVASVDHHRLGVFVSHGLAGVGLTSTDRTDLINVAASLGDCVTGYEYWPVEDGETEVEAIERVAPEPYESFPLVAPVGADRLPYTAAAQVRQFNRNMASFAPSCARYAPEFAPLVVWAHSTVIELAETIRSSAELGTRPSDVEVYNNITAALIELNAGLSMLASQLLAGNQPALRHDYPIGEYSLLGIGGVTRGLWSQYYHLNEVFNRGAIIHRLSGALDTGVFPFFRSRQSLDLSQWDNSRLKLSRLRRLERPPGNRVHVLYFSSRAGFHETLYTMSASWQCVHAGASRDWNLLTLSHEYLHALVRELVAVVLGKFTYEQLQAIVESDSPGDGWEAMAGAMVSGMHHVERVRGNLRNITAERVYIGNPGWNSAPDAMSIASLIEGQSRRYMQEVLVHVLDYLYVYAADDTLYVESIWGSWTFVPVVMKRLHHYLLRTLAALSARNETSSEAELVFDEVRRRLAAALTEVLERSDNPVVAQAKEYLLSPLGINRLSIEFEPAYYLARLARTFMYDGVIARDLLKDDAVVEPDSPSEYDLSPGDPMVRPIESPTRFLLDRFRSYPFDELDESRAFESLWQLLILADPREGYGYVA